VTSTSARVEIALAVTGDSRPPPRRPAIERREGRRRSRHSFAGHPPRAEVEVGPAQLGGLTVTPPKSSYGAGGCASPRSWPEASGSIGSRRRDATTTSCSPARPAPGCTRGTWPTTCSAPRPPQPGSPGSASTASGTPARRSSSGVRERHPGIAGNRVPGESWVAGSNPALSASIPSAKGSARRRPSAERGPGRVPAATGGQPRS
jgi:hypothetical protein